MMKKILIVWSWMMLIGLVACSDWVDVNPKTEVEADDFFRTDWHSGTIIIVLRMPRPMRREPRYTIIRMMLLPKASSNLFGKICTRI